MAHPRESRMRKLFRAIRTFQYSPSRMNSRDGMWTGIALRKVRAQAPRPYPIGQRHPDVGRRRRLRPIQIVCPYAVATFVPSPEDAGEFVTAMRGPRLRTHRSSTRIAASRCAIASSVLPRTLASRPRYRSTAPTLPSACPIAWRPAKGASRDTRSPRRSRPRGAPGFARKAHPEQPFIVPVRKRGIPGSPARRRRLALRNCARRPEAGTPMQHGGTGTTAPRRRRP